MSILGQDRMADGWVARGWSGEAVEVVADSAVVVLGLVGEKMSAATIVKMEAKLKALAEA
jgi:hypothetical protein